MTFAARSSNSVPQLCSLEMFCFPEFRAHYGQVAAVLLPNLSKSSDLYHMSLCSHWRRVSRWQFRPTSGIASHSNAALGLGFSPFPSSLPSSPSTPSASSSSSSSAASSYAYVTVIRKPWRTLCYGWRGGFVQPHVNVTAPAVTATAAPDK